eukprot:CAMPEP_0202692136 /NCGR_PEP_ID=MMETSP1385-20130828/6593_1 /ASSEMBLY_ACC=CAM_ASM_000861 /TAXON_ID=933848 /ORGANISM="Elphidium margaritaceum" /LENGTH=486 /DNA_ID=CAMNT_0049347617 /DNA_START=138 /DNA_END=1594 /DNA_ORIENTATION=+
MHRSFAILCICAFSVIDVWAIDCDGVLIGGAFAPVDVCTTTVGQNTAGEYFVESQMATCLADGTSATWTVWGSADCTGTPNVYDVATLGGSANCGTTNDCAFYLERKFFYEPDQNYTAEPVNPDCATYEPQTDELFGTDTVLLNECVTVDSEARKYGCDLNTYGGVKYDVYASVTACEAGDAPTDTQSVASEICSADGGDGIPVKQSIVETTCSPEDYDLDCDVILIPDTWDMYAVGVCWNRWNENTDGTFTAASQKRVCSADGTTVNHVFYDGFDCQAQTLSTVDSYIASQGGVAICGTGNVCPTALDVGWYLDESVTYTEAELCSSFEIQPDDRYWSLTQIVDRCEPYGSSGQSWIQTCNADGTVDYAIYATREECLAGGTYNDFRTALDVFTATDSWSQCTVSPLHKEKMLCPAEEPSYDIDCDVILMDGQGLWQMYPVGVCWNTWKDNEDGTFSEGSQTAVCDGDNASLLLYTVPDCAGSAA